MSPGVADKILGHLLCWHYQEGELSGKFITTEVGLPSVSKISKRNDNTSVLQYGVQQITKVLLQNQTSK